MNPLEQKDKNAEPENELVSMGVKVIDFAALSSASDPGLSNSGNTTEPHSTREAFSPSFSRYEPLPRIPEWFDPYMALSEYVYHIMRRALEALTALTRHDTEMTEPATRPATPTSSATDIEEPETASNHHPLRRHLTPNIPIHPDIFTEEEINEYLRYTPKDTPRVRADSIPIPGKTLSRLLAIDWVTREEAESTWLPIDWVALQQYEERPGGPYPFTLRKIPQRVLPEQEIRKAWMESEIEAYNATLLDPDPTERACREGYQRDAIATYSDYPPLPTRAGIWVYPDGAILKPSNRAKRAMILYSGQNRSNVPTRYESFKDSDEATIADGLGDDIPTAVEKENIFKARVQKVASGYWARWSAYHLGLMGSEVEVPEVEGVENDSVDSSTTLPAVEDENVEYDTNAVGSQISGVVGYIGSQMYGVEGYADMSEVESDAGSQKSEVNGTRDQRAQTEGFPSCSVKHHRAGEDEGESEELTGVVGTRKRRRLGRSESLGTL